MEARDRLSEEGIETAYMRLRSLPIGQEVRDFIAEYENIYVVEMNQDGQLHMILRTDIPERAMHLKSVSRNDGWPLTARWITQEITK